MGSDPRRKHAFNKTGAFYLLQLPTSQPASTSEVSPACLPLLPLPANGIPTGQATTCHHFLWCCLQAAEHMPMQGRNCCFMKKGEGNSLGVRMTTGEASHLLGTREKGGTNAVFLELACNHYSRGWCLVFIKTNCGPQSIFTEEPALSVFVLRYDWCKMGTDTVLGNSQR